MKNYVLMYIIFSITSVFADCDKFLSERLGTMNLGKLNQPSCGVMKKESVDKMRISLSKEKGRKDLGPTLSLRKQGEESVRITQLLSKDKTTGLRHKYRFEFGTNCSELKSLSYTLGTLQTDITQEKCNQFETSFVLEEKVNLSAQKICDSFFPEKILQVNEKSGSGANAQ